MKKVTDAEIAEMQPVPAPGGARGARGTRASPRRRLFETNKGSVTDMIGKGVTDVSRALSETRKLAGQRASGQV